MTLNPMASRPSTSSPAAPAKRRWRWGRWVLAGAGLLLAVVLAVVFFLDPWLRHTLEKQVSKQTHGQYQLAIGALHTSLWNRSIRLRHLRLRPAAQVADTLPRLRLDLAQLRISGVGLWALLRRKVVPIDTVLLDSTRLNVLALPKQPTKKPAQPLHQQLPLSLDGLDITYFGLLHTTAAYQPATQPRGRFAQANLTGHQLLISAAGAADTARVAYATAWRLAMRQARAEVASHHIAFGRLRFATTSRRLVLDSFRIREPAPGQGKPGAVRINLTLPHAVLAGLRAAQWQHQQHFRADSLLLARPALRFTPPAQRPPDLWKMLEPLARRSDLAFMEVRDGRLEVDGLQHAPSVRSVNATGTGIRVDSLAKQQPRRVAYATAWQAQLDGLAATFKAPFYRVGGARLHINTAAHTMRFEGLALTPHFTPAQMNVRAGYQIPQFTIRIPELAVTGLDYALLVRHGDVHAARIVGRRPVVRVASDGRGPISPHRSIVTPENMRKVHTRINVRRLDLEDGNLYTRYRSASSPVVGTLNINRFSGTLRNVSNEPAHQTRATPLTGSATAYLQNTCRMSVHIAVPLLDPLGRHRVWGTFGAGNFAILNSLTVPTKLVKFRQGRVQHIDFALRANQQRVTGTLTARYTGLQLELLSYKQGEIKQSLGKKIISKAANVLVIRDQNPRKGGRVVSGDMTSKREPRFSVFVLWRQGVLAGLLDNIGLPQPLAQKISQSQTETPLPGQGK